MKRIFLAVFLLALYFGGTSSPTFADENFTTSHSVTYFISEDGQTQITQDISIKNRTATYYISEYKLILGSENITNVSASDPGGKISPQIIREEGQTTLIIKFNVKVIGREKALNFQIRYSYPGVTKKRGIIWEVLLPQTSGLEQISSYHLEISAPKALGPLLYSSPPPRKINLGEKRTDLIYEKEDLLKGAPRATFGEFQLYKLKLTYHLENPQFWLGFSEIALPSDILGYQKIFLESLNPRPISLRVDTDGNYLARYNLGSQQKLDVIWEGFVAIFYPSRSFTTQRLSEIPPELISLYTQPQKYWEADNLLIKSTTEKLINPELPVFENAYEIYNFVVKTLSYNEEKLSSRDFSRLGALSALSQPDQGVCMEYTDLFIALARAAGIPAREVNGFAYADEKERPLSLATSGGDVLHAWPQIFIPGNGWMMVDPTWGSTAKSDYFSAFDLSHIAFVVKGISSEYPLPAGSYKTGPNQKDVEVFLSEEVGITGEEEKSEVEVRLPQSWIDPLPFSGNIVIKNTGKSTIFKGRLVVSPGDLKAKETGFTFEVLPPLGEVGFPVNLGFTDLVPNLVGLQKVNFAATLTYQTFGGEEGQISQTAEVFLRPLYFPFTLKSFAGTLLILSLFGISARRLLARLLQK